VGEGGRISVEGPFDKFVVDPGDAWGGFVAGALEAEGDFVVADRRPSASVEWIGVVDRG
jgi:hypothetical protein